MLNGQQEEAQSNAPDVMGMLGSIWIRIKMAVRWMIFNAAAGFSMHCRLN
jgi:hypothetical protein